MVKWATQSERDRIWKAQIQTLDARSCARTHNEAAVKGTLWGFEDLSPPVKPFSCVSDIEREVSMLYPQVGSLKYSCRALQALDKIRRSLHPVYTLTSTPESRKSNSPSKFLSVFCEEKQHIISFLCLRIPYWSCAPSRPVGHFNPYKAHVENPTPL